MGDETWSRLGEIHRELSEIGAAPTPDDTEGIELLRAYLDELDEVVGDESMVEDVSGARARLLRAVVRSRLSKVTESPTAAAAGADLAWTDALAAGKALREISLHGVAAAKYLLPEVLRRLMTILIWRSDYRHSHVLEAEAVLIDTLAIMQPDAVSAAAAARLAYLFGEVALTPERQDAGVPAAEIAQASERWADEAIALLPARIPPAESLMLEDAMAGIVTSVDAAVRVGPDHDRAPFLAIARGWDQLEAIRSRMAAIGDAELEALLAGVEREIGGKVVTAIGEHFDDRFDEDTEPSDYLVYTANVRMAIDALPDALWDRDGTAEQILERLAAPADHDLLSLLQRYLDDVEIRMSLGAVSALSMNYAEQLAADIEDEHEGGAVWAVAILTVASLPPGIRPSYLAAGIHRDNPEVPLADVERDVADQLSALGDDLSRVVSTERLPLLYIELTGGIGRLTQASPPHDPDAFETEIDRLFDTICRPVAEWSLQRGIQIASVLFTSCAELTQHRSPAHAEAVIASIDRADAEFRALGEMSPALELARAKALIERAKVDERHYVEAATAAAAVLDHIDANPRLPDDDGPFDHGALIASINHLAHATAMSAFVGGASSLPESSIRLVRRLRALAADETVGDEDRAAASRYADNLDRAGRLQSSELELSQADLHTLIDAEPIAYLVGLIQASRRGGLRSPVVPADVARALRRVQEIGAATMVVSAQQGSYLGVLASPDAKVLLDDAQRLAVGVLAGRILDTASPAAAEMAFRVVLSLSDLDKSAELAVDFRRLVEDVGERYLPVALRAPSATAPAACAFMLAAASGALNLGALRAAEHAHRLDLAMAAHLLAVKGDDAVLAASSAYLVAELYRTTGRLQQALEWFGVHDHWLNAGDPDDPRLVVVRESTEYDRRQLLAMLESERKDESDG